MLRLCLSCTTRHMSPTMWQTQVCWHVPSRGPGEREDFATFKCKITRLILPPLSFLSFILFPLYELPLCFLIPILLFPIPTKIRILLFLCTFVLLLVYLWSPYLVPCFWIKMCFQTASMSYAKNIPDIKLCWHPSLLSYSLYAAISIHHFAVLVSFLLM